MHSFCISVLYVDLVSQKTSCPLSGTRNSELFSSAQFGDYLLIGDYMYSYSLLCH